MMTCLYILGPEMIVHQESMKSATKIFHRMHSSLWKNLFFTFKTIREDNLMYEYFNNNSFRHSPSHKYWNENFIKSILIEKFYRSHLEVLENRDIHHCQNFKKINSGE